MKYFTPELWRSWQAPGWEPPPPERDPFILYRRELETLRPRLHADAFRFFTDADVHDGELMALRVVDGSRPTSGGPWVTRTDYPVVVGLAVLEATGRCKWTLSYRGVRRVQVDYLNDEHLFPIEGSGFGDWGYHELSDVGDGFLRHEVLFRSGSTLLFEFRDVEVAGQPLPQRSEP